MVTWSIRCLFLLSLTLSSSVFAQDLLPSEAEALSFLEEHLPEARKELEDIKKHDPEDYQDELHSLQEFIEMYRYVNRRNKELAQRLLESETLDYQSHTLARELTSSKDDAEKQKLRSKLMEMLTDIFTRRMEGREFELEDLEEEIRDLKADIKKRKELKEVIIKRRLEELLQEEGGEILEW